MNPEVLAEVWVQHGPLARERVDTLDRAIERVADGTLDADLRERAHRAAHQLAGSVGLFGFTHAGELARALEKRLVADAGIQTGDAPQLAALAGAIRTDLGDLGEAVTEPEAAPERHDDDDPAADAARLPLVLFAVPEGEAAQRLRAEAGRRGMRATVATLLRDVPELVHRGQPAAVVLDFACEREDEGGGLRLLGALRERAPQTPVLVIAAGDELGERLAVARAGAEAFLEPATAPTEVVDQVALLLQRTAPGGARVLVVAEEANVAAALRTTAVEAGLDVEALDRPLELLEALRRTNPSLVLLDDGLRSPPALDLVRVLRGDRRWAAVPVLALAEAGADAEPLLEAGADEVLRRPLGTSALALRLRGHLERYRTHQALAETDPLTGLGNRRASTAALGQLLRLADRMDTPLCLVELDVDRFKAVNDTHGHLAGDGVLRRLGDLLRETFRGEDVVARWGGEEFVVGMLGMDRDLAVDRMLDVLATFRGETFATDFERFSCTFSAGVAQFPADGLDLEELYGAADEALYTAKRTGRDQVVGAGGDGLTQRVDVAIVEDDETTSKAVSAGLKELGHRCWRFSNGAGALAMLSGPSPRVRARVILLDLDLPALDGFEVLTVLEREGVLRSSRVIVVSGSDAPEDVARTSALGAIDYVFKPAALTALAERVDVALGRRLSDG